jgi:hypothetical protein
MHMIEGVLGQSCKYKGRTDALIAHAICESDLVRGKLTDGFGIPPSLSAFNYDVSSRF